MIECSSCGLMINKNDKKCPRCGHVFDVHKKQKYILTGVGAAAVGAGVIAAGVASHEKETKSTIKSVKNNAFKKSTEKIENTESVKKADLKVTTKNNNPKTDQTSTTAYGNKKYNDSLEINENNNSTKNDSSNSKKYNEDSNRKTNKTEEQMSDETTTSSKESNTKAETKTSNGEQTDIDIQYEGITQEDVSELIEKLKEKQGNEKAIEKILKEFSEDHKDDENLEALLELLMNGNETTTDADMNIDDSEDEDISKSSADGGDFGGGISISFAALENALACLGGSSLASNVNVITECKFFGSNGGLDSLFDEFESPEYDRIPENETSYEGYRKTISNFFNGENGEGGFTSTLKSKLEGLRESLIEMYGKDYYGEAFSREMAYQIIDENGEIDLDKALRLYNSTVKDGKYLDKDSMTQDEIDTFLANFTSNENINDYFEQTTQKVLEKIETINSDTYKSTDFYLKCEKEGRIPTEREVLEYYENYGDGIAADLLNGAGILGLTGILENKTINSIIGNRVQEGLYGRNTDENGDPTGEEIPDYDGKTDNQKRLEILTYSWYADNEEYQNLDQYKILSAYVDDYCETKDIDRVDLSIDDHLYQLLQAGASNALWDSEGNIRTRTYFDEETGEMSEQEKIIQRYERAITGGYNENGELDNHRDSEWRINRTTFEESFILSDNYVRKSDALTEATKNHSELFKVDDETKEIIYDDNKETSEYDENEKELYEIAKKASEEYKEALDAMNLFGFFVNQSQIDEAKQEAGENYSKDDYPAGVKEYLEYMNSDNKNPYQYMAKYDADNYSDAVEKFGDSMGSKVPHVIEIFSEMPSVKEGRITAEELAKNLSNSLSTNADYYHMYLESVEGQHITNVTGILSLAKTSSENYKGIYNVDQQTIQYLEGFGTPEEKEEAIEKSDKDYEKWQNEEQLGKELAQEIGDSQARLSTMSRDIETVQYNKIMAKLPTERTEEEKDFCMRYRIERTTSEQKEFIAQLNDYYEKLSNCENINEATQLLNYISMINENKLCNLEQVFEGKKLRLNEDFEEASKSIIARVEYTYEYDKDGVYGRVTYMYDSEGNKIEASEEEYELYLADLARKNGGELPFYYKTQISCELLEKINCLANNDTGLLTYKYHREDSETFKMDYKNYFQYGALVEATKEYEEYLAKLEKRGDFGDWITTAGYGAKAGLEQFADGFRSFMNPDGIKSISEYRSMLISSYLIETYGSDALNSNFMLGTYEISTSMANMLPSIALSMLPGVGQYLSLTAMFISSAGNSMEQAYQSGYTLEQSYIIGLISGALETGLQAFASGITSLGIKFAGGATVGARAVEKVVANAAKKEATSLTNLLLSNLAKGSLKRALAEYGINILSEGLEEGTQEILGPILENTVKYGIDYNDDFQEWKNIMNNMSLEEWQESKFIEWKAENLSNNTTRSQFFSLKDMTFEDWIKKCEKGEIYDLEGNALKIDLEEFNYLKSTSYTAKKWFDDNKSSTDIKSVLKSAIYGSISGGLFEGATHFAPEVISYSRTGTTLGMNSLVNAVRNQAAASGTPKNIFQIFAEVNQIIKDQSKTGKMSDLVANYLETSSFRSDYESFCNEMNAHLEEEISEVEFATMKVADNLAKTSLKNRLIESLNSTTYQSYQEILDARDRITRSEELIKNELEGLKSNENGNSTIESLELSESLLSELIKEREDSLKALAEKKAGLDQVIKMKESLTEDLKLELSEELTNIIESINSNESTVAELEQLLSETTNSNNSNSNSKAIEELENRIDGKTKELNNKKAKNEITKKQIEIKTKEIEQLQEQLKSLKENTKKGKEQETQKINETINKLKENIESNKARMNEIESITEIIANPKFELSSLTTEQFNNFISNLDYNSLKVYAKDIVSRLSDLSDTRISELIERLDPITLGVFENQVVERVKHITEEEVLNNIKDKNASKFTQNIYEIEVSADTTTNTTETVSSKSSTETVVSETITETVSENTVGTEPSTNIRNNNSTETVLRETVKPENETSRTEAKKELVSQNAALGTVGLIQMGALTGGLKGNQTLNNVLETIQTDINSLNQRYDSTTINGEVNVETEVNVNEETNSNNNVREELKSQIDQKTKLYNDLTQLMSKYGVDGSELLTTLKEEIVSGKYKLEHQLLNTETNIEETITDSITESEAAIKEIMQQFDLTKVDQTTLNEARTAAMYKILEIANKNNISVDSILSKINIDEMLAKNDIQSEYEVAAARSNGIVEETDNLTEEDLKHLKQEEAQDYLSLMEAIKNIRNDSLTEADHQNLDRIYNKIKGKNNTEGWKNDTEGWIYITRYISYLKKKMYEKNLLGTKYLEIETKTGKKIIKVNKYGKNDKILTKCLGDLAILLEKVPPFVLETTTEINLYEYDSYDDMYFSVAYNGDIRKPFNSDASGGGSQINIWKSKLLTLDERTLFHELGHNIDTALGKYEQTSWWTKNNNLWEEAIEKDGGRDHAPSDYAKTNVMEDFAESFANYMKNPLDFQKKFPNRAKIIENFLESYTEVIDCSYESVKAIERRNKVKCDKLHEKVDIFRKTIPELTENSTIENIKDNINSNIATLYRERISLLIQQRTSSLTKKIEELNTKINQLEELKSQLAKIIKEFDINEDVKLANLESEVKSKLEAELFEAREIEIGKHVLEEKIKVILESKYESQEALKYIDELFNKTIKDISDKCGKNAKEIEAKINITEIFSKIYEESTIKSSAPYKYESPIGNSFETKTEKRVTTRIEKALNDICYNNVNLNTIKNLQEVIEGIPAARRAEVMDAILVRMIKGETLNQETSDAIFKSKMFDGDSNFAKEYLHHVIEAGIPELGIKGSQELANKISKVYEKARETTKEMSNLHSYCDHTEAHVLQVAFDTVAKGKQIAASKGQTLSETQIKNLFYTGLFHDLGMASGAELGISLETQIVNATEIGAVTNSLAEVINGLNANVIRENHSLNSALQVLRMREELESLGLNVDLIAMMCFSHSKSNSGVGNLSSEGDWSYSVSKIRSALEIMNKASGENITLNLENIGGYETLKTTTTDSVQKITKDANGNKIKTKLKVSGIPRITFEEGVLNDLEIMSLAIRMGDAYVTKANVKLEEPIRWVGIDGKTYSTDLLVLTQAGVYMAYDATQTAISTKYKQTDDTETSVESAFIYLTKTEDGRYVPWKEGYGVDAEGRYTNVKDSLMYAEDAKIEIKGEKLTLTENGYCYKTEGDNRIYYKLDKNGNVEEIETISKEKIQEVEEKYGKTLRTSTGKFLVGESNVSYNVEVIGDVLVSTYKIGDIEIFQSNTISKGIAERIGEIATSRNITHEVNVEFKEEQFMSNFKQIGDKYIGITPTAQEYIKRITDFNKENTDITFAINGIEITEFVEDINAIKNLQEVIEGIPAARRAEVMDAILVRMIKGETLNQETSDAIFKSKMFDGDSNFAKEYLHHVIEAGIPELGIKGSQELANKISKVYEKARETTKEMSNLHSYCDHTEAHVLQVAFDTVAKGKQIAASKGQTLSETQIKNLFYTGLFHDLGMASGAELGISLETQIVNATEIGAVTNSLAEVINGLNANVIRENHSLNSALQVLRMREELESLGLNVDLIAMMCFSHSKSNSGVGNLSSEGDWSYSVSKIRSALEIMNKASGENITLNLENIGGYETLKTTTTDSVQKITKDANGNKIKTKLKVSGIPRITFEEGVLNDLEIMSLAIRMGDAYVTKANVKLEEPIRWVGIDGKTYSTDLLVLTQAGVYMAYDATQTAISTKYKQTDDTETSVESAFIYLTKTEDGRYVPWKEGYGVDAEGRYTNVKDSLMYAEDAKIEIKGEKLTLTENGYCYKTEGDNRIYYKLDKNGNVEEIETISKEKIQEVEEKYGKTLRTSTGKFLVGESNVSYNVEVIGDVLVSTYKIGDIEIFQSNTISKGIAERIGEIATSRNITHEVNVEFKEEQFMSNFKQIGDKYIGITPTAQEYIKRITDFNKENTDITFAINGIEITEFVVNYN